MLAYIIRRLILIVPTLLGIMVVNFVVVQFAPGGPVERIIAEMQGTAVSATERIAGGGAGEVQGTQEGIAPGRDRTTSKYRGAQGLDPQIIKEIEQAFGFDKPLHERFLTMMANYIQLDFGTSYFRDRQVVDLVLEKMPVSISLGLWTTLLVYLTSIPLGVAKAVRDGSRFDVWTSGVIVIGYAIPSFLLAVLLIVLFAGSSFLQIFPLRGLVSSDWHEMVWWEQIADYFWHIALPVLALVIGGFAALTMLTKNRFSIRSTCSTW